MTEPIFLSSVAVDNALELMCSPLFRLPTYLKPLHYALELQPVSSASAFAGSAYMTVQVTEAPPAPLTHVILHALQLTLEQHAIRVSVPPRPEMAKDGPHLHPSHRRAQRGIESSPFDPEGQDGCATIPCTAVRYVGPSETVLLTFEAVLPSTVGDIFVVIIDRFDGRINIGTNMEGLYHSSLNSESILSTHLEPTNARRVFPCFDEPAMQATFQLSVIAELTLTVLSNTEAVADTKVDTLPYPVDDVLLPRVRNGSGSVHGGAGTSPLRTDSLAEEFGPKWHCVLFSPTPPLHTCIIGFHVGRFNILEQHSRLSRILCRVVLPHAEPNSSGWFALDLATKALDFFEEFFDVRLPLTKLDVVAMELFPVLGMENWGLINLHRDYLIVTDSTSLERRQRITRLIGHETCHQWFGNWISLEWWDGLWLKEGMCRYLEYVFVHAIYPDWGLWNEFICNIMNGALRVDANPADTHPVEGCNGAPRRIYDSFDTISYGKGACVLRMLFSVMGVSWLRRATHQLMIDFAGRAINAEDLETSILFTAEGGTAIAAQATAIRYALRQVQTVSHPYFYIEHRPGVGYQVTQYVAPCNQHGLLADYVQHQRRHADAPAIDLFSSPAHSSFVWHPETTLTAVETPFTCALRTIELQRSGRGPVGLVFIDCTSKTVPLSAIAPSSGCGGIHTGTCDDAPPSPNSSASSAPNSPLQPDASTTTAGVVAASATSARGVYYFNHGGCGFYQCEYDMSTWRLLFDTVGALSDEDRMVITTHFINSAKSQLGHQPGESGERCTLLFEWLLRLTSTPGAMNSFLWDVVTSALTQLVHVVQQYYCQSMVRDFINQLYAPLLKRGVLSFFAPEKSVYFQSSNHLSRQLVLSVLQLLCLCENTEVLTEAEEAAQWALATILTTPADSPQHQSLGNTSAGSLTNNASGPTCNLNTTQAMSSSIGAAMSSDSPSLFASSSRLPAATAAAAGPLMSATPRTDALLGTNSFSAFPAEWQGIKNNSLTSYPYQRAAELDVNDPSHIRAGEIALSYLASQRRLEHWVAAAAVATEVLGLNREALIGLSELPVPAVRLTGVNRTSRDELLRMVLPAVFSLDQETLFPFMANVFAALRFLQPSIVTALYRNSRFFLYLIDHGCLSNKLLLNYALICGAEVCGNGFVVAQLKALTQGGGGGGAAVSNGGGSKSESVASSAELFKELEFADSMQMCGGSPRRTTAPPSPHTASHRGSSNGSTTAVGWERSGLRQQSPVVADALDRMEANCVWMDYCCWHYDRFLRDLRRRRVYRQTRSEANSSMQLSGAVEDELSVTPESIGGVSI